MADGIRSKTGRLANADEGKCGRPLRGGDRRGLPCRRELGAGTDHLGEGACYLHGGRAPRGAQHWAFKHGKFSKHWASLGEKMEGAIADLASDPDYLHLRRHIATLDFLFLQELALLEGDVGGGGWDGVRRATNGLAASFRGGDAAGINKALKQLRSMAESGVRRDKGLARIQSLMRDRVHTTRADQSRVEAEQAYATIEQLKQIALVSAQSVASQLDLFTRQVLQLLSAAERLRVQEPFQDLKRATLQGVSESFRQALVGRGQLTEGNGAGLPPDGAVIVVEAVDPDSTGSQTPPTVPGPPGAAQASAPTRAVPLPYAEGL